MPVFRYKAVDASGAVVRGRLLAANENELSAILNEARLELIDTSKAAERKATTRRERIAAQHMAAAFRTLANLTTTGMPLIDVLRHTAETTQDARLRNALGHVAQAVTNGQSLAHACAEQARFMPPLCIALIEAGEQGDDLPAAFSSLADYFERRATVQDKLAAALRYPLFLLLIAGGAVGFLLTQVIPNIVQFLQSLHGDLPATTRALIAVSDAVRGVLPGFAVLAAIAAVTAMVAYRVSPRAALWLDARLMDLPLIGDVIRKSSIARFCTGLSLLLRGGCEIGKALRLAREAAGNRALAAGLESAAGRVTAGADLSNALQGVLPAFACSLLRTGEQSGDLTKSLSQIADMAARDAQARLNGFVALLEPSLTVAIGGVLAWTVLAVLGPLYGSLSLLGGRM